MTKGTATERRRAKRRPILDTFSIFVVVPRKGVHRLQICDLSDEGIGFELDTEGESYADFNVNTGDSLGVRLYLTQSLYLPLSVEIARLEERGGVRRVGASFSDKNGQSYRAFSSFLKMLDGLVDVVQIEQQPVV